MKITVENIGPIKKANLELGGLTVIAGDNNTGKTYLAYALYGFMGFISPAHMSPLRVFNIISDMPATPEISFMKLSHDKMRATLRFSEVLKSMDTFIDLACAEFSKKEISAVFATSPRQFESAKITIHREKIHMNESTPLYEEEFAGIAIRVNYSENTMAIDFNKDMFPIEAKELSLMSFIIGMMIGESSSIPFVLPAERISISLFYKGLDYSSSRITEEVQRIMEQDEEVKEKLDKISLLVRRHRANYAKPIAHAIDFMRGLDKIQKDKSVLFDKHLFGFIENMVGGHYEYEDDTVRFVSDKNNGAGFDIPLDMASSSVRGLCNLYFHLKHKTDANYLVIIDEPESHLTPQNQIEMARLIARCVNAGIKILITTHSDYIIKELNNLIMLSHDFEGKDSFLDVYKKHYTKDDYLKKDNVKFYLCENGGLSPCKITSRGAFVPNFEKTIDEINNISNSLNLCLPDEDENDAA